MKEDAASADDNALLMWCTFLRRECLVAKLSVNTWQPGFWNCEVAQWTLRTLVVLFSYHIRVFTQQHLVDLFWRARSRYRSRHLQMNSRSAAFIFSDYKICALLHRSKVKRFTKSAIVSPNFREKKIVTICQIWIGQSLRKSRKYVAKCCPFLPISPDIDIVIILSINM